MLPPTGAATVDHAGEKTELDYYRTLWGKGKYERYETFTHLISFGCCRVLCSDSIVLGSGFTAGRLGEL